MLNFFSEDLFQIMFLLFMVGFTTALMKHHNHFYLFDSHSRDSRGLSVVDGTSVLLKFSDLFEVENYIQVFYLECHSMEQSYFQLQFIHFRICRELQLDILSCAKRVTRRLNYQEKSTNLQSKRKEIPAKVSMKNDLSKKKKLEFAASSTSQERMLREDNFTSSENLKQVTLFKKLIREGPYFICMIYSRCLYKRYIVRFDFSSYSSLVKKLLHLVSSYDGRLYICRTCHNKVEKSNVHCQAVSNKLAVELLPYEFRDLGRLERDLVAKRILLKKVTVMPKG